MTNTQAFLDATKADVRTFTLSKSTYIGVGTGTTTETTSDSALEFEVERKARQEYSEGTSDVVVSLFLGSTEGNGEDLTEVAAFDASSGGNVMMRKVFPAISKTASVDVWIDIEEQVDVTQ